MKIGIAGDWHGDLEWALRSIRSFRKLGIYNIQHLGDFGVWSGRSGEKYLYMVNQELLLNQQKIYVTIGNHENYARLSKAQQDGDYDEEGISYQIKNYKAIRFYNRPTSFELQGLRFLSIGGANSIDHLCRVPEKSWWSEEQITDAMVEEAQSFGKVDIVLAHDAPIEADLYSLTDQLEAMSTFGSEYDYALESQKQCSKVFETAKPSFWLHGHHHKTTSKMVDNSLIVCLNRNGSAGNLGVLDIQDKDRYTFKYIDRTDYTK